MKVLLLLLTAYIVNTFGIPAPENDLAEFQDDEILFSLDGLAYDEDEGEDARNDIEDEKDGDDDGDEKDGEDGEDEKDGADEKDGDDGADEKDGDDGGDDKDDDEDDTDRRRHHSHSHSHSDSHSHERRGSCAIALGGSTNCFSNVTSCSDSAYLQAQIVAGQRVASSCCSRCNIPTLRPINVRIGVKYCKRAGCCFTVPSTVTGSCLTLAANSTYVLANRCFDQTNLLNLVSGNRSQVNVCRRSRSSHEFASYFNVTAPLWPRVFCRGHHC